MTDTDSTMDEVVCPRREAGLTPPGRCRRHPGGATSLGRTTVKPQCQSDGPFEGAHKRRALTGRVLFMDGQVVDTMRRSERGSLSPFGLAGSCTSDGSESWLVDDSTLFFAICCAPASSLSGIFLVYKTGGGMRRG